MTFSRFTPEATPSWAVQELHTANLGDQRLNRRLATLVAQLAAQPNVRVPQATGSWAATKATYRLWASARITPDAIRAPQIDSTLDRVHAQPLILAIEDTTSLDFTHHPATRGLLHQRLLRASLSSVNVRLAAAPARGVGGAFRGRLALCARAVAASVPAS